MNSTIRIDLSCFNDSYDKLVKFSIGNSCKTCHSKRYIVIFNIFGEWPGDDILDKSFGPGKFDFRVCPIAVKQWCVLGNNEIQYVWKCQHFWRKVWNFVMEFDTHRNHVWIFCYRHHDCEANGSVKCSFCHPSHNVYFFNYLSLNIQIALQFFLITHEPL